MFFFFSFMFNFYSILCKQTAAILIRCPILRRLVWAAPFADVSQKGHKDHIGSTVAQW